MFIAVDQSDHDALFVVASFWLPLDVMPHFEGEVMRVRSEQKYWREAHFSKLKKMDRAYTFTQSLLKTALREDMQASFAVLIADNDKEKREKHFNGSYLQRDAAFMYELISRRYRWWGIKTEPYVVFDDLTHHESPDESDDEPEDEAASLHVPEARKHLENFIKMEVQCFSPCRSHTSSAVQVADVLAGMTALRWLISAGIQKKPNPAKLALLEWFEQESGKELGIQTTPTRSGFSVWRFTPR